MNRPTGWFEQPVWTAVGLLVVVCGGPVVAVAGVAGFVPDEDRVGVVVTGLVWTLLGVVVLVLAVGGTARDLRVWRELDTAGVRAMGVVTSAERVPCGEDERCTGIRMLVKAPGRPPFTTSHLVPGEEVVEVGSAVPVDVHPTRALVRLAADRSR
ncbi:hypothetical protein [Saccharothrix texasensis]|uniref:hypothetical protein n=1 Tax=Saccharothrix texasensis TaxID=103734 RepID=UPI0011CDA928|nr:hypothetical protein [Saccharothrix texasensis]